MVCPEGGGQPSANAEAEGRLPVPQGGVEELFHRVNRLLPEGQKLRTVPPETPASEALALMLSENYSQLPVVADGYVLGGFSYRSYSRGALDTRGERTNALDLPVDEFVERLTLVEVTAELNSLFDALDADGAVGVSHEGEAGLVGIVTGVDALRYLYELAELFVQLQEIEQALRALMGRAVDNDSLHECIKRSLGELYKGREDKLPQRVTDMTFAEYVAVIADGRNWSLFVPVLGSERGRVRARLERVGELRNDVFHFRRVLTEEDRRHLLACREWLRHKVALAEGREATRYA